MFCVIKKAGDELNPTGVARQQNCFADVSWYKMNMMLRFQFTLPGKERCKEKIYDIKLNYYILS